MIPHKKHALGIALLPTVFSICSALLLWSEAAIADVLRAGNYRVTITVNCPEGTVVCDDVSYQAVNVNTGASLRLNGQTVHSFCADGVTPCRFQGYEFRNQNYRYFVTEDGQLRVFRGEELILNQPGTWEQ